MRNGIIFLLIGSITIGVTPLFAADNPEAQRVELYPSTSMRLNDSDLNHSDIVGPRRDPGDDEIFYDQGAANWLTILENYWSRTSFTPRQNFRLEGFRQQFYNPNGER